ncbi:HEAT repeat domain-containing protein [Nocardia sp. CWNU-33]|uniref:HEAT repeat domain-containing protein n=1 Tax=Nocardia sp. CWNU-33 TaxID=3392117 RepID=UPI00398F30F2
MSADLHQRVAMLLTLLGSPLERVRQNAVWYLAELGPRVAPVLRALRSTRMPGRHAAISALAELDWTELDTADRVLLQRLIRVKQLTEVPQPMIPQGEWYALPTTDQAAVLAAFDLRDPVPATMRMGFAPWQLNGPWQPLPEYIGYGITGDYGQVFVTPALDGWTLVFADSSVLAVDENAVEEEPEFASAHRRCAELSRRFGTAHWYLETENGGCWDQSGWCVADNGEVVRFCYYDFDIDGGVRIGPAAESGRQPSIQDLRAWVNEHDHGTGVPPCGRKSHPASPKKSSSRRGWKPGSPTSHPLPTMKRSMVTSTTSPMRPTTSTNLSSLIRTKRIQGAGNSGPWRWPGDCR